MNHQDQQTTTTLHQRRPYQSPAHHQPYLSPLRRDLNDFHIYRAADGRWVRSDSLPPFWHVQAGLRAFLANPTSKTARIVLEEMLDQYQADYVAEVDRVEYVPVEDLPDGVRPQRRPQRARAGLQSL